MKLFVFMGASGSGKSTIQHSLPMRFLTHYTTRLRREEEIDGYHIKHISLNYLALLEAQQKIATLTKYDGDYYASPIEFVYEILEHEIPYHATATIDSTRKFKEILGEDRVVIFYIKTPSVKVLEERMRARGDSEEKIEKRIAHIYSANELENELYADYVIINDYLDEAVIAVKEIIKKELGTDDLEKYKRTEEIL